MEVTPEVLQSLRPKHSLEPVVSLTSIIPADDIAESADKNKITRSLPSFSGGGCCGGCCGGIDGLRQEHLLDLVVNFTAVADLRQRQSITTMASIFLLMLGGKGSEVNILRKGALSKYDEQKQVGKCLRLRRETPFISESHRLE